MHTHKLILWYGSPWSLTHPFRSLEKHSSCMLMVVNVCSDRQFLSSVCGVPRGGKGGKGVKIVQEYVVQVWGELKSRASYTQ
jgi:hypothetical protein